jgi:hypothetical protein
MRATAAERRRAYSPFEAERIVRGIGDEARWGERAGLAALAGALGDEPGAGGRVVARAVAEVEAQRLLLFPGWAWARESEPPEPAAFVAAAPLLPSELPAVLTKTFELVIIDAASGRPLEGIALDVITSAGDERRVHTDGGGRARIEGLPPGTCDVASAIDDARVATSWCPSTRPRAMGREPAGTPVAGQLVEVERHRVRAGQTAASVARDHGVSWERIALFNWGTTDPEALQDHFRDTLGCRRKSPDGRLCFDDADEPGILLVPRRWRATLAVGAAHELRVEPLRPLFISLENEAGLGIPATPYAVRFSDGSERRGWLGSRGIARLDGVPDGAFAVTYPDQLDLLAKSLAVSVRRGFDEHEIAPLCTLLMQSDEVVERTAAAYHRHCNDLTGGGLAADIDQVVTDPEARRPLLALCALARVSVDGVSSVTVPGATAGPAASRTASSRPP